MGTKTCYLSAELIAVGTALLFCQLSPKNKALPDTVFCNNLGQQIVKFNYARVYNGIVGPDRSLRGVGTFVSGPVFPFWLPSVVPPTPRSLIRPLSTLLPDYRSYVFAICSYDDHAPDL